MGGVPASLDHVTVAAGDLAASTTFYDAALGPLGLIRLVDLVDEEEDDVAPEAVAYGTEDGGALLWVVVGPAPSQRLHLCLRAPDRRSVEGFHAAAVAAGGLSHDAPRRWPLFRTGDFNAIVADPDGNLIEVVAPE